MKVFREFDSAEEAIAYRRKHGTGGWIFERYGDRKAILFPPDMRASECVMHPITDVHGKPGGSNGGELIGCRF